jgi:hypothetical protein
MRVTSSWCGRRRSGLLSCLIATLRKFGLFAWGVTESKFKAKPHNKTENLIQKIKEVKGSLDRDTVVKACNSFKLKIENVVTADGDFIK